MNRITGTLAVLALTSLIPGLAAAETHKAGNTTNQNDLKAQSIDLSTAGVRDMQDAIVNGVTRHQKIPMYALTEKGTGKQIGTITANRTPYGVLFEPELSGLSTGIHGFHLHQNPDCGPTEKDGKVTPGGAAGGHFNPNNGDHNGPYKRGHLGDLPALYVNEKGEATVPVLAPRLEFGDLAGHALIIHQGGDNYSDQPAALGGGGARAACGVIEK